MILKSSNKNDIPKLSSYGKAKAILRLNELLPNITAFQEVILIDEYDDLMRFLPFLPKSYFYRRDILIGTEFGSRVPKDGNAKNIVNFFQSMKQANSHSALLILATNQENLPRYISNGGFNVSVNKNVNVVIELVGKGFDGRELTHGSACHESYIIPWESVLFCDNFLKLNQFCTRKINGEQYAESRKTRLEFLSKIKANKAEVDCHLPNHYVGPDNQLKNDILNEIVLPLFTYIITHHDAQFQNCWVCGNITHKNELVPFEFSSLERIHKSFVNPPSKSVNMGKEFYM